VKASETDVVELTLTNGMQIGGFIQDEDGRPIAGASIDVQVAPIPFGEVDPTLRMRRWASLHSNDKGQWLSPPMPESDKIFLLISHPDYISDHVPRQHPEMLDVLRSGIATMVLKK